MSLNLPVLIIGAGPVGVTLSMELAIRGVTSIILEKRRDLPANPRCNTTNARSMEIFRRLGCADAVRAAGLPAEHNTDVVYMTAFAGKELTRYRRPTTADWRAQRATGIGADWATPEPQHFISQLYLEPVLRRHAVQVHGVELREGQELLGFEHDADGVAVTLRDVSSGEQTLLKGAYLVGCDGSNSLVRSEIGARLEGVAVVGQTCSTFFRSPRLTQLYRQTPGWMYRFLGGGVLVAIDGIDLWLLHLNIPAGVDPQSFEPEPELFRAIGEQVDYEILQQVRWTPRALVANKYREGRVFVAGDAAHIWIPMGGFGMNAGVADATTLGWMLAGVMRGWLDPKILDAYGQERAPLGARVAAQAVRWGADLVPLMRQPPERIAELDASETSRRELGARIHATNSGEFDCPGMQLGYFYENSPIIVADGTPPPPFTLEAHHETSWPGARAPHLWLAPGKALIDALGTGFALLRIGADAPDGAALIEAARQRALPLQVLALDDEAAVRKYEGYALVLVRPDQHVAWRSRVAPSAAAASAVLDRVTGALMPETALREIVAVARSEVLRGGRGACAWQGKLAFASAGAAEILVHDPVAGGTRVLCPLPSQAGAVAALADGRLLVSLVEESRLVVVEAGRAHEYANLGPWLAGRIADLTVDAQDRVFVADTGGRVLSLAQGVTRILLEGLAAPGSIALSADARLLYVAETANARILQCRLQPDGSASTPRSFVLLHANGSADLVADARGGVWNCSPIGSRSIDYYDAAGRMRMRVNAAGAAPVACALRADAALTLDSLCESPQLRCWSAATAVSEPRVQGAKLASTGA